MATEEEVAPGEDRPAADKGGVALPKVEDDDAEASAAAPPFFAPPQAAAAAFPMMMPGMMPGAAAPGQYYPAAPGWPGTMMAAPVPFAMPQAAAAPGQPMSAAMMSGAVAPFLNPMMYPMAATQGGAATIMPAAMGAYPMMAAMPPGAVAPHWPEAAVHPVPQTIAAAPPCAPSSFGNGQHLAVPANFNLGALTGAGRLPTGESALGDLLSDGEKKKRRKKRKDKPKRPLSAYNLFFKDERTRILADIPDKDGTKKKKADDAPEKDGITEDIAPPPLDGNENDAQEGREGQVDGEPSQTQGSTKRKAPHGKIGFESLAKTIGGRWKELAPDRLEHYKKLADEDTERYAQDMEEFAKKIESEKEAALAGATDQTVPMDLASAAAAASGARQEAQRIAAAVGKGLMLPPAVAADPSTSAGGGRPPPAKKKRGRRPRDSLLDPEALAAWTQQCQQAVTGASAAAAAAEAARQAQHAFHQAGTMVAQPAAAQTPAAVMMPAAAPGMMMPATAAAPGAPAMMMVPGAMAVAMHMPPAMAMPYPAAWPVATHGMSPMAAVQQGAVMGMAAPLGGDGGGREEEKSETV